MRAILRSYGCDGRYGDDLVTIGDGHDFAESPYEASTIPFPVGSNQQVLSLEDAGLTEGVALAALIGLTAELTRSRFKFDVRKDFGLMNAHAFASKVIHNATDPV